MDYVCASWTKSLFTKLLVTDIAATILPAFSYLMLCTSTHCRPAASGASRGATLDASPEPYLPNLPTSVLVRRTHHSYHVNILIMAPDGGVLHCLPMLYVAGPKSIIALHQRNLQPIHTFRPRRTKLENTWLRVTTLH